MDYPTGQIRSIPHLESYFHCHACGRVFYDPSWQCADVSLPTPCCGGTGQLRLSWPPRYIRQILDLVTLQDVSSDARQQDAVMHVSAAASLWLEVIVHSACPGRQGAGTAQMPRCIGDLDERLRAFSELAGKPADSILADCGREAFVSIWRRIEQSRTAVVTAQTHSGPGGFPTDARDIVAGFGDNMAESFAALHNAINGLPSVPAQIQLKKTVLIVDDDTQICMRMGKCIERMGVSVIYADSGEAALEQYAKHRPSCVLMDVMLPGMDGLTTLEKIRAMDGAATVYFMTGVDGNRFKSEATRLGARGHFLKPIVMDDLARVIKSL